jgi:hypothetical protein
MIKVYRSAIIRASADKVWNLLNPWSQLGLQFTPAINKT